MNSLFELAKDDLGITAFVSSDENRAMLRNVLVRMNNSKQVELVATDGYVVVKHHPHWSVGETFNPFLIPAGVLNHVNKLVWRGTKKRPAPIIEVYKDRIIIEDIQTELEFMPVGRSEVEKFPDIDKVLSDIKPSSDGTVKINPALVSKVMRFMYKIDGMGVDMKVNDKLSAVEISGLQTYAAIMPLKG